MDNLETLRNWFEIPLVHLTAIIIASIILGGIAQLIIAKVVVRLTAKTKFQFDDKLAALLQRPVGITVVLVGCWYAQRPSNDNQ